MIPPEDALTELEIQKLKVSIESLGPKSVAKVLGVSRLALMNCLASMNVHKGTIALIRQNFGKLVNNGAKQGT